MKLKSLRELLEKKTLAELYDDVENSIGELKEEVAGRRESSENHLKRMLSGYILDAETEISDIGRTCFLSLYILVTQCFTTPGNKNVYTTVLEIASFAALIGLGYKWYRKSQSYILAEEICGVIYRRTQKERSSPASQTLKI
jgi:hypothetical protein